MNPASPTPYGLGRRSEDVLLALRGEIDQGIYASSGKLPTEKELCERFQVSRTTVRRAVARLVSEQKLSVRKGSGMYLRPSLPGPSGSRTISVMYNFDEACLAEAQDYALQKGFLFCVYSLNRAHWSPVAERTFLERVKEERHRALLAFCSPLEPRNDDLLHALEASGVRVIHIEHYRVELPRQSYLLPDYRRAGHLAAMTLGYAGYTRLFYASMSGDAPFTQLLEKGFAEALAEQGTRYDRGTHFFELPRIGVEGDAMDRLKAFADRARGSAGVLCKTSQSARLLLVTFRELGLRVPEDIGLIGPELLGPVRSHEPVDTLEFDREGILRRALDEGMQPSASGIRELVAPRLIRRGTIRVISQKETSS
ncbi:MAG: GntR family transcriptional regulator [Planctomycetes bacterium]|nr:GntR family transcriptional regulator [Planctomycetota bacterium]